MKGAFNITLAYLRELGACRDGQREFQKAFPDGGEYQEVLDRCADEGRVDFGQWLLSRVGPTEDVRVYEDAIDEPAKCIIFAGRIEFGAEISVKFVLAGCGIEAGEGIMAGWGIKAGKGIEAGKGIMAGWGVEAGKGFCVFAGLRVRKSRWELCAVVTARTKPSDLRSGFWRQKEADDEQTP